MMKSQIFYVFDEHTDYIRECEKLGFVPVEYEGFRVTKFEKQGRKYNVLGRNECYSGWEINVVHEDVDSFEELMFLLLNSRIYDEKAVSIGLMLKNHYNDFLSELNKGFPQDRFNRKRKKAVKLITKDICGKSYEISEMKELLEICRRIK